MGYRWTAVAVALGVLGGTAGESAATHSVPCTSISVPPGAVYLYPDAPTSTVFQGNSFAIDGNDGNLDGTPGPKDPIVGFAARTETNAQEVRDSLAATQLDNITGQGFSPGPPVVPSVAAVAGPAAAQIDQFIADLLTQPHVVHSASELSGNVTFGTTDFPQISHFVGQGSGLTVRASANASGAGIMIVENALTVLGVLDFKGIVLVRGALSASGSGTLYGSIWTSEFSVLGGSSLIARYSSEALAFAETAGAAAVCETGCGR